METICLDTNFTLWEGSARKDGSGISSSNFPLDDFRAWPRAPLDGYLSTAQIVPSSSLTMTSMIKKRIYNASYTISRIVESSILFELPSKFFGHSCYSDSSPPFSAASHFRKALEYRTITMKPLLLPPMMKACPLEESYLLQYDLFYQPISYVTVSLTLLLFFSLSDRAHRSTYDMGCQKRSYGRRYDSSSGHAFIIGGRIKGIIWMVLYSKAFLKCYSAENIGGEAEEH